MEYLTRSVCPVCLRRVDARYEETGPGRMELIKNCPDHGPFRVAAWVGEPAMSGWRRPKIPSYPR